MFKSGPANKRKGIKTNPKPAAQHPKKSDDKFGSKTDYAKPIKTHPGVAGGKAKKK